MDTRVKSLTSQEWWRFVRKGEKLKGEGPLTGLPLASVHPTASELIRVRDLCAMWLMGHCGFRVGEVVKLGWSEVMCDGLPVARIEVSKAVGKDGFTRTLPVDAFVAGALFRLHSVAKVVLDGGLDGRVLGCGPRWRPIGTRILQRKVAEFGRASLGRSVGCHELRHTFAVRVRRASDIAVCQQLLGHRRLASTQIYAGVSAEECATAVASLSA